MELFLVITAFIAGGLFLVYNVAIKKGRTAFWDLMKRINEQHGTSFPTDATQMHLVLAGGVGQALLFDEKNRKLFFLTNPAQCQGEVLDYSYLRHWVLQADDKFIDHRHVYRNVRIEFGTNDIRRPVIKIPAGSYENGSQWINRLSILLRS